MLKLSKRKNRKAFSLTEMMIVLAIIGVLLAVAIPNFTKIRANAYRDQCITNLRRIASAKEHWSLETGAADTATPTEANLESYMEAYSDEDGTISSFYCPLDSGETFATSYNINNMKTLPGCKKDSTNHKLDYYH